MVGRDLEHVWWVPGASQGVSIIHIDSSSLGLGVLHLCGISEEYLVITGHSRIAEQWITLVTQHSVKRPHLT